MAILVAFGIGVWPIEPNGPVGAGGIRLGVCEHDSEKLGAEPLIIEESGYTGIGQGCVMNGFKLTNPNESSDAQFPTVQIMAFGVSETAATFEVSATPWM